MLRNARTAGSAEPHGGIQTKLNERSGQSI
jgi:hypothetical protein